MRGFDDHPAADVHRFVRAGARREDEVAGLDGRDGDVLDIGLQSLKWLVEIQRSESGHFAPIGSDGFWVRNSERARFDQQPIEAHSMISACLEAYAVTRDSTWYSAARRCFEWFLGRNDLGQWIYDAGTGGCHDALHSDRVNQNQGAESSLAFHLSLAEMNLAEASFYHKSLKLGAV